MNIDHKDINRVLVLMLGGIGNMVLFSPVLRALRRELPDIKIDVLVAQKISCDILEEGLVDNVILLDHPLALISKLRANKYDLAIVSSGTNALKAGLLTWFSGIRYRLGENVDGQGWFYTHCINYDNPNHETHGANQLLEAIGVTVAEPEPRLYITQKEQENINQYLDNSGWGQDSILIGMHAGSGEDQTFKRWDSNNFVSLIKSLQEKHKVFIVLTGSKQEQELNSRICQLVDDNVINVAGKLSLRESAALVNQCNLFVSNDSGLAHIAAAVQTPLVVLFGSTDPRRIAPLGNHVTILRKSLVNEILPEDVLCTVLDQLSIKESSSERKVA